MFDFLDKLLKRPSPQPTTRAPTAYDDIDIGPVEADEPGSYLSKHNHPQAEQRHGRAAMYVAVSTLGLSMALNAVLGIAILNMLPLSRPVPYLVTLSPRTDVVATIDPIRADLPSGAVLNEQAVREYVKARNTIGSDAQETLFMWNVRVKAMSAPAVYDAFVAETKPIYDEMMAHKFTRSVQINAVNLITPGFYRVEFEATDRRIGQGLTDNGEDHRTFIAEMRVADLVQRVRLEDRFINPIGFTVLNYSVSPKK